MTLGYSRKCVRLLVFRSSARVWAELHEKAFRRLGGSVRVVVLDNLKEGVLKPDIYDPTLSKQRRPTSIAGKRTGPTRAFMALPNGKWPRCLLKSAHTCCHCHWNLSAFMNSGNG